MYYYDLSSTSDIKHGTLGFITVSWQSDSHVKVTFHAHNYERLAALPDFHPEVALMWGNPIN
jgi:hypothetical protein